MLSLKENVGLTSYRCLTQESFITYVLKVEEQVSLCCPPISDLLVIFYPNGTASSPCYL
jgi:hypothetical protein